MTSAQLVPAVVIPLVAWRVYARIRRNIGRQPLIAGKLKVWIGILIGVTALISAGTLLYPIALVGLAGGLLGGAAFSWVGLQLTKFEQTSAGVYYTPNTAIGITLSLLLVARIAYRFIVLYQDMPTRAAAPAFQSPLTLVIFGLTVGYYLAYYIGVLMKGRHLHA